MDERQGHDRNVETYLITSAEPDRDAVFAARKRRYFIMMSIRIPALIIASIVYGTTQNAWWAVGIILISIPIPWIAVLKANDREPRKHGEVPTYHYGSSHSAQPLLTSEPESHHDNRYADDVDHPVIDIDHDEDRGDGSERGDGSAGGDGSAADRR